MSDLTIQGEVQLSTEGVESALNRVGEKAGQMANKIQSGAEQAGKAVDGIGTGAGKSADEFTRAEGRIVQSIKRATTSLELLGKTASQKLEFRISEKGLDASKFEPMLAKLRELEVAQNRVTGTSRQFGSGLQNTSYQLQDFITQVNGGTDATRALSMQLPQMLVGFGAVGAAIGVVAALLPNLISSFSNTAAGAKNFNDSMSDFDKAIGDVGSTTKTFDMEKLYEEFNKSSAAVRAATIEQLKFQQEYIRTTQLVANKKFGESLGGLGEYSTLNKLAGSFGNTGSEKLAQQLGISLEVAKDLLPILNGLRKGSEDVGLAFNKFGTVLLGGNQKAVDLAASMATLAKSERDAASASTSLSEAQAKMSNGTVAIKKDAEKAAKAAKKEAEELANLIDSINGKDAGFDASYVKNVETLLEAYDKGKLTLGEFNDVFARYVAMQPGAVAAAKAIADAEKEAVKARQDYMRGLGDETAKLIEKANASDTELQSIGMTADQLASLTARRYDEQIAIKEAEAERLRGIEGRESEVYLIEQQIEALNRLKNAEVTKPKLQEQARAWENFTRDIEQGLTDALYRGFEAGNGFGQNFADTLKNTFKAMVLKVAVQAIVSPVMSIGSSLVGYGLQSLVGGSTGTSGSSGMSVLGAASNLNSLYNLGSNASIASQWITGSMSTANVAGTAFANMTGTGLDGLLATNGAYGTAAGGSAGASAGSAGIGGAGMVAGGILAGMLAANALYSQGYKWDSKNAWFDPWAEINTKIGKAFGFSDRVTAILQGNSISQFVKESLFGGSKKITGSGIKGTFTEEGFDGRNYQTWEKKSGLFGGGGSGTDYKPLTDGQVKYYSSLVPGTAMPYIALNQLGGGDSLSDRLGDFSFSIKRSVKNEKQTAKLITDLSEAMGKQLLPELEKFRAKNEVLADTAARLSQVFAATNTLADVLGKDLQEAFGSLGFASIDVRQALVDVTGGLDAFKSQVQSYYQTYFSQEEQFDQMLGALSQQFTDIGLAMPSAKQGFRDLVEGLDLTTFAGQKAFGVLMSASQSFSEFIDGINDKINDLASEKLSIAQRVVGERDNLIKAILSSTGNTDQLREIELSAIDPLNRDLARLAFALEDATKAVEDMANAGSGIASFVQSLRDGRPKTASQISGEYFSDLAAARTGNVAASERIPASAQAYLDLIQSRATTSTEVDIAMTRMAADLAALPATKTWEEVQAKSLGQVVAATQSTDLNTAALIDGTDAQIAEMRQMVAETIVNSGRMMELNASILALTNEIAVQNAEKKQEADIAAANIALEAIVKQRDGMVESVSSSIQALYDLGDKYGAFLNKEPASAGNIKKNTATIRVNDQGLFESDYADHTSYRKGANTVDYLAEREAILGQSFGMADDLIAMHDKIEAARQAVRDLGGIPAFAGGGDHLGGLRLVGERGPELEATGPSRIFNFDQTRALFNRPNDSGNTELIAEIRALREDNRAQARAIATLQSRLVKLHERWDGTGIPETRVTA